MRERARRKALLVDADSDGLDFAIGRGRHYFVLKELESALWVTDVASK